jgi:hypothetical protein
MAFVNIPPNFQDMFYALSDRIAKLETGPNQAMYTAEAAQGSAQSATAIALNAQSVAEQAEVDAINAGIQANNAASQATIAQSQATIASSQATAAQVTANGKNKVYYSTSGPGSTANTVGDIWYQYGTSGTYANKVIAQFSGAGGTSWTSVTVSGLIIANIDAGSITTGTLSAITISAGTGANAFNVSSSGVMSAQGAWIKGNITADSGTFNGTVNAATGYFGNLAGGNYWSIGASGLTGVGSAVITGGLIQGSSITVPNSGAWKFAVDSAGSLQAVNANVTGAITATSGTISGALTVTGSLTGGTVQTSTGSAAVILNGASNALQFKTSGSVVGNMVPLSSFGVLTHYGATADPSGGTFPQMFVGSTNCSVSASATQTIGVSTSGINLTASSGGINLNNQTNYTGIATGSGSTMVVVTTGSRIAYTTSSERFKQDIQYIDSTGWLDKVLTMKPITYKTSVDFTTADEPNDTQIGFLAEDIADIGGGLETAVILDPLGDPFSLSYDRLTVFLTLAIKEIDARLKILEGK